MSSVFSCTTLFGFSRDFDKLSKNVSKYENTFIALLNFIASNDNSEFCIDQICSLSHIISDISLEKKPFFVIAFLLLSKVL